MPHEDLRKVGLIALGAGSSLFLNHILPPKRDSILKTYATTMMNVVVGIIYSRKLENNEGYLYAGGSVAYALMHSLNSLTESSTNNLKDTDEDKSNFEQSEVYFEHVKRAIERAIVEFERNVTEPSYGGDWRRIDEYIRGSEGLGDTRQEPYTRNNQYSWCGAFIAFAWGAQVRQDIRSKMVGCTSLYKNWAHTPRYIENKIPESGDIVTIFPEGKDRSHIPGYHIALAVTAPDAKGFFQTIEGNTIGTGVNRQKVEGVIPQIRHISSIAHVYRLLPQDFVNFYEI